MGVATIAGLSHFEKSSGWSLEQFAAATLALPERSHGAAAGSCITGCITGSCPCSCWYTLRIHTLPSSRFDGPNPIPTIGLQGKSLSQDISGSLGIQNSGERSEIVEISHAWACPTWSPWGMFLSYISRINLGVEIVSAALRRDMSTCFDSRSYKNIERWEMIVFKISTTPR